MYCRNCGNEIHDAAVICVKCGVPAGKGKGFCQTCGEAVGEEAMVCLKCGSPIEPVAQEVPVGEAKSKLAAVSFIVIRKLQAAANADKETRAKIIQRYSKEVEHYVFKNVCCSLYCQDSTFGNKLIITTTCMGSAT